jgi:Flp pilus assembly protein TadG
MVRNKLISKKGQSLVEFALVLPLLILLLVSIIEFGFIFNSYLTINNAAREGGRVASLGGSYESVRLKAEEACPILNEIGVLVAYETGSLVHGKSVKVTVTYNHHVFTPIIGGIIGNEVLLTTDMTVRVE